MSDTSPRLELPLLAPAQAQKHVTHNEALRRLDALVQLVVETVEATDPPPAPAVGALYALGNAPTGAWAGDPGRLAYWTDEGGWLFITPQDGWCAFDRGTGLLRLFSAGTWTPVEGPAQTENLPRLGINTTSGTVNRLAVASDAALFSHDGDDIRVVLNKATAPDTASLVYQTNFGGRAEIGLAGSDDWTVKVSDNGTTWREALRLAAGSGIATGTAVQSGVTDTTEGRLMTTGAFGLGGLVPLVGNISVTDGSIATGFYRYQTANGSSGAPADITTAHVLHTRRGAGGGEAQTMIVESGGLPFNTGTMLVRSRIVGAWSDWRRIFDSTSVVGPVSQSGGLPTGGLMESGDTAGGTFRRFADGTQICTHTVTTLAEDDLAWSYPVAFATGSVPVLSVQPVSSNAQIGVLAGATATEASVAARDLSNIRQATSCHLTAIGRWF